MTILTARKLLLALCITGPVGLVGCGDPGSPDNAPGAGGSDGNPYDQEHVDGEDFEVDFGGFTVAPPPVSGPDAPFQEKDSFDEKLERVLESTRVPSSLAGAFFQLSRAYLSGRAPLTEIEEAAFAILDDTSPDVVEAIERTLDRIDELPSEDMERLYGTSFLKASPSAPLTKSMLTSAVAAEIQARASLAELGEVDPEVPLGEELAGLVRDGTCSNIDRGTFSGPCPNVCRIRTESMPESIRTAGYLPWLTSSQLTVGETEDYCSVAGGCVKLQPPHCKLRGATADGVTVCMAVPRVRAGETVRLEGFNFHDVDAVVGLGIEGGTYYREVEAHVRGDTSAGQSAAPDCEVRDVLHFEIPTDLPEGIYWAAVFVEDPEKPSSRVESSEHRSVRIEVVPPVDTRFQFAIEELTSMNSTGDWGSDEIGIKVITIPVSSDGELGEMDVNGEDALDFEFGDVDRGEKRCFGDVRDGGGCAGRSLFSDPVETGFAYAVIGYEIDNRKAYEEQVRAFADAYVLITKSNWGVISKGVGAAVGTLVGGPVGGVVGTAVAEAINVVLGMWAPADLIIEDFGSKSFYQMAELTGVHYRNPPETEYETAQGVDVVVGPCEDGEESDRPGCDSTAKVPGQYRESRRYQKGLMDSCDPPPNPFMTPYQCEAIGSEFQLTFRYNRLD